MKTIEFEYGGKALHLYMNGEAMFAIEALDEGRPEGTDEVLDRISETSPEAIADLCRVAVILAEQGELCRRYLQYTPSRVLSDQELRMLLSPLQLRGLCAAVYRAVNAGFGAADADGDEDIDTGLAELEKKTRF